LDERKERGRNWIIEFKSALKIKVNITGICKFNLNKI